MDSQGRVEFFSKVIMSLDMFQTKEISTRKIMYFIAVGVMVALVACFFISMISAELVGHEIEDRDIEFLFGAVESGPLEIAKLQSASIAQQALHRIMLNPKFEGRGIESVDILGGESYFFKFASWKRQSLSDPKCYSRLVREYSFHDSINSFKIEVSKNKCFIIKEKKLIFWYSGMVGLLAAVVSIGFVALSVWPVGQSIRDAERLLLGLPIAADKIRFTPINDLVVIAQKSAELEKGRALADVARQVSHDIQSPLSVLNLMMHGLDIPSEKLGLIRSSLQRINEISNSMLRKGKVGFELNSDMQKDDSDEFQGDQDVADVVPTIEALVKEKSIEFTGRPEISIEIEVLDDNLKSKIPPTDLARIVSNLINNAADAIKSSGRIKVCLKTSGNFNIVTVSDDGIGIPQYLLDRIGQKGLSFGKVNGNGLGLYSAKEILSKFGGKFEIHSILNAGTMVTLMLPRSELP